MAQKWARHKAPFLEPMGAMSVVFKTSFNGIGKPKIGFPKNTNLDLKLVQIFEPLFLIPFAHRVMLFKIY